MAIGATSYYIKEFTHKGKLYKFIKPLRVRIDNYLSQDLKQVFGELNVVDLMDGYTQDHSFPDDPMPEIKAFLRKFIDEVMLPPTEQLKEGELEYKIRFWDLLKKPRDKED